jgi:hypothetical protein
MERTTGGQSVSFQTTGRESVNEPNHKWVKCTYPLYISTTHM